MRFIMANEKPVLAFTPHAYSKLMAMLRKDKNEIGGFGVTEIAEKPTLITDIVVPKQIVGPGSVSFDDDSIADITEEFVYREKDPLQPWQFLRIWIHTHPGISASPSNLDEQTFDEVFGIQDYSIMFIISQDYKMYARVQQTMPIPMISEMEVLIAWEEAYERYVSQDFRELLKQRVSVHEDIDVVIESEKKTEVADVDKEDQNEVDILSLDSTDVEPSDVIAAEIKMLTDVENGKLTEATREELVRELYNQVNL